MTARGRRRRLPGLSSSPGRSSLAGTSITEREPGNRGGRAPLRRRAAGVGLAASLAALLSIGAGAATAHHKAVALTFDDGPSPYTSGVLRELKRKHASATFFVVGENLSAYGSKLRPMMRRGHEIANHTWSHPFSTNLSSKGIEREIGKTNHAIRDIARRYGRVRIRMFRPPYGDVNERVRRVARHKDLRTVLWDVDPADYLQPSAGTIVDRVVDAVDTRSIVLLHDGGGPRGETVDAVPRIIHKLRQRNFRFLTLSQYFKHGRRTGATSAASVGVRGERPTEPPDAYQP